MPVIATAGWSIPGTVASHFPATGSGLERYGAVFSGVEINSTFYRRHRPATFQRWADGVPAHFRFAVKMPGEISHERRLRNIAEPLLAFLDDIGHLGTRLGPLLCQLPPSLAFEAAVAEEALGMIRERHGGRIVIEPRHRSWASSAALALLDEFDIERVLADPPKVWTLEDLPSTIGYMRLHGSPAVYHSSYDGTLLRQYADRLVPDSWCVFDNTASGAAIENALTMLALTDRV